MSIDAWQGLHTWADVKPCGTAAAYRRHLRHGERPCRSCLQAERRRQQELQPAYNEKRRERYALARAAGLSSDQANLYASSPGKYPLPSGATT